MNQEESKKKRGIFLWIIIFLLVGSNAVLVWLYLQEKNKLAEKIIEIKTIYVEKETIELAVMIDTFCPLMLTEAALKIDDGKYYQSWF